MRAVLSNHIGVKQEDLDKYSGPPALLERRVAVFVTGPQDATVHGSTLGMRDLAAKIIAACDDVDATRISG